MEYLWNIYGISMEYLWNIYGINVDNGAACISIDIPTIFL